MLRNLNQSSGGKRILGVPQVGILAETIAAETATGDHGPGILHNESLQLVYAGKFLRARVIDFPSVGTLFVAENGKVTATDLPDGLHVFGYALDVDGDYDSSSEFTVTVGSSSVYSDSSLSYTIRNVISADLAAIFKVRGNVAAESFSSYAVRTNAFRDSTAAYSLRGMVQADDAEAYKVRGLIQASDAEAYNIRGAVTANKTAAYDIQSATSVANSNAVNYAVRGSVTVDSSPAFAIRSAVQADNAPGYALRSAVYRDAGAGYAIDAAAWAVSADNAASYVIDGVQAPYPTEESIAAAVLAAMQANPPPTNTVMVNHVPLQGDGTPANPMRPA